MAASRGSTALPSGSGTMEGTTSDDASPGSSQPTASSSESPSNPRQGRNHRYYKNRKVRMT